MTNEIVHNTDCIEEALVNTLISDAFAANPDNPAAAVDALLEPDENGHQFQLIDENDEVGGATVSQAFSEQLKKVCELKLKGESWKEAKDLAVELLLRDFESEGLSQ